ncbi:MAG: HDIG domain-containing metalloprotein, partial [Candidatus Margulisiibacteriota bacterium]
NQDINKEVISRIVYLFSVVQTDAPDRDSVLSFLTAGQRQFLVGMDTASLESLRTYALDQAENSLDQGIQQVDPDEIRAKMVAKNQVVSVPAHLNTLVTSILLAYLRPNLVYDPIRTQELIETELSSVTLFNSEIKRGTPILYEGQVVTKDHLTLLKKLNIYGLETNFLRLAGIGITVGLLLLLLERFFYYFTPPVYQRKRYIILTHVLILFTLISARVLQLLPELKWGGSLLFLIPVPVIAIILGLTVSRHVSVVVSSIVSVLVAMMLRFDTSLLIYLFLLGCGTTFTVDRTLKRSELIRSGYIIGLIAVVIAVGTGLMQDQSVPLWYATNLGVAFLNGVVSTMISLATLPYIEQLFKITTSQTLLEYSNLNHPLMKQLMMSAPGTYQHSLMVSNLAEAAAEAIGADPVLARTGAYFHDIGKIKRPAFFSENQFSGENPHQSLSPRMSKLIIASHVKEGTQLAEKYKLPDSL